MKRIIAISFVVFMAGLFSVQTKAQFSVGAGYSMYLNKTSTLSEKDSAPLHGFNIRAAYNFELAYGTWGVLGLESGLVYDFLTDGVDLEVATVVTTATVNEHYFNIPLLVNYAFDFNSCRPYIFAGPTISLGLSSQTRINYRGTSGLTELNGNIIIHNYSDKISAPDAPEHGPIVDLLKYTWQNYGGFDYGWFDVKLGLGIGVQLMETIDLKVAYNWGLINRYKGDLPDSKQYTDQLYITLAHIF